MDDNPSMKKSYEDLIKPYGNFTDGLPKDYLFINLNKSISKDERGVVTNGIRAFFKDDLTLLLDKKEISESLQSSLDLMQIFVTIIGFICLTLSFFLLLISTTANIKENLWELGVLRAVGLSQDQSRRVFMYEAFAVIFGALLLGIVVGLTIALTLTAQFYLFIELPFKLAFPTMLFVSMIIMSLGTTFFAVWIPVKDVNKKKIASILKGTA
jgi:ABC-type antimicrobial peptide transport system permease subunit